MKAPINTNNRHPFSNNIANSKYHSIESSTLADSPRGVYRTRQPYSIHVSNTSYLKYSVPNASDALELSKVKINEASVFPRNIYKRHPVANKSPSLEKFRDLSLLYTYSSDPIDCKERIFHPSHQSSRFGYDRFPGTYEYGIGMQSRGYVEPTNCHDCVNDTPKNMAPEKFYTDYHLRSTPTEYRKVIDQRP